MTAFDAQNAETSLGKRGNKFGTGGTGSAPYPAAVTRWIPTIQVRFRRAFDFQAQLYGFADALGNLVEGPRLRVASGYLRD